VKFIIRKQSLESPVADKNNEAREGDEGTLNSTYINLEINSCYEASRADSRKIQL
jgi:hypothetical protein